VKTLRSASGKLAHVERHGDSKIEKSDVDHNYVRRKVAALQSIFYALSIILSH
jgi:hypothetical protein